MASKSDAFFNSNHTWRVLEDQSTSTNGLRPPPSIALSLRGTGTGMPRRASEPCMQPFAGGPAAAARARAAAEAIQEEEEAVESDAPQFTGITGAGGPSRRRRGRRRSSMDDQAMVYSIKIDSYDEKDCGASAATSLDSLAMERRIEDAVRQLQLQSHPQISSSSSSSSSSEQQMQGSHSAADQHAAIDPDVDMYNDHPSSSSRRGSTTAPSTSLLTHTHSLRGSSSRPFQPRYPLAQLELVYIPSHRTMGPDCSAMSVHLAVCDTTPGPTSRKGKGRQVAFAETVEVVDVFSAVDYPGRRGPPPVEKLTMRDILELRETKIELGVFQSVTSQFDDDDDDDDTDEGEEGSVRSSQGQQDGSEDGSRHLREGSEVHVRDFTNVHSIESSHALPASGPFLSVSRGADYDDLSPASSLWTSPCPSPALSLLSTPLPPSSYLSSPPSDHPLPARPESVASSLPSSVELVWSSSSSSFTSASSLSSAQVPASSSSSTPPPPPPPACAAKPSSSTTTTVSFSYVSQSRPRLLSREVSPESSTSAGSWASSAGTQPLSGLSSPALSASCSPSASESDFTVFDEDDPGVAKGALYYDGDKLPMTVVISPEVDHRLEVDEREIASSARLRDGGGNRGARQTGSEDSSGTVSRDEGNKTPTQKHHQREEQHLWLPSLSSQPLYHPRRASTPTSPAPRYDDACQSFTAPGPASRTADYFASFTNPVQYTYSARGAEDLPISRATAALPNLPPSFPKPPLPPCPASMGSAARRVSEPVLPAMLPRSKWVQGSSGTRTPGKGGKMDLFDASFAAPSGPWGLRP